MGYAAPNYTQIPNAFLDNDLAELSGSEAKVLLYIMRRTLGFHRDGDHISLSQIEHGNGHDKGSGVSHAAVLTALAGLEQRGMIAVSRTAKVGSRTANYYELVVREAPTSRSEIDLVTRSEIDLVEPLSRSEIDHTKESTERKKERKPTDAATLDDVSRILSKLGEPDTANNRERVQHVIDSKAGISHYGVALEYMAWQDDVREGRKKGKPQANRIAGWRNMCLDDRRNGIGTMPTQPVRVAPPAPAAPTVRRNSISYDPYLSDDVSMTEAETLLYEWRLAQQAARGRKLPMPPMPDRLIELQPDTIEALYWTEKKKAQAAS